MLPTDISQDALHKAPLSLFVPDGARPPLVLSSPHSGRDYPSEFIDRVALDAKDLRQSEDAFVEELYAHARRLGAPMLAARFPRAYVDVNRDEREIDTRILQTPKDFPNTEILMTPRVRTGLGVIARVVSSNTQIYKTKLSTAEVKERLATCYKPYHATLKQLIHEAILQNGYCLVLDCHSMPSPKVKSAHFNKPDIVLGDRFGESCSETVTACVEKFLRGRGYGVSRNVPYAGGHITSHYGDPTDGIHVLQIELSRSLYMDERRMMPNAGFDALRSTLADLVSILMHLAASLLKPTLPLAEGAE